LNKFLLYEVAIKMIPPIGLCIVIGFLLFIAFMVGRLTAERHIRKHHINELTDFELGKVTSENHVLVQTVSQLDAENHEYRVKLSQLKVILR